MIKVNKSSFLYLLLLIIMGFQGDIFLSFSMVIIHEFAHYSVARLFGFSGFDMEILPFGGFLKLKDIDEASPREDIIISLSGPLINLIFALICYILLEEYNTNILNLLFKVNMALGIFNLIPALPLDGGRILRALIAKKTVFKIANFITVIVSLIFGSLMMFFYILSFYRKEINLSLGIIAIFIMMFSFREKGRCSYIIMSDIINKKCKFLKRGYIENKSYSIHYSKDLLKALSIVERNKYNVFTVLDDELKVIDIIYEGELLEAVKAYGNITIEEFIKIKVSSKIQ